MSCTCKTNFGHCVCADTLLFVSLFDPEVKVPKGYVGATVSKRKQCKKIGGLAGRRKTRVLEERQDDEKVIHSKAIDHDVVIVVVGSNIGKLFDV